MSFSHRRENDEKSRRDSRLGLSIFCWEAHTHGSQQLFALALLGKPTFAVREVRAAGKSAPAGANCRIALAARSACSAVDCTSLPSANTCREPTRCVFGSHKRSSGTLAVSFRSFLVRTRKEHVSPLQRRKYVLFSLRRKAPKDSPRLPSRTLNLLLESAYTRLERCCSARRARTARTGHHSPCRGSVRLGSPRPQAQGARRVSASRRDVNENGGG